MNKPRWALWDFEGQKWDEIPADNAPGEWRGGHSYGDDVHTHRFIHAPFTGQLGQRARIFCETCGESRNLETA